ncbi:MAG: TldD/PmbA family protein [Defluviitaleaceae bacterium]|nr:TldD/PmbA family protein [Defluviitaleaceae bacterium]
MLNKKDAQSIIEKLTSYVSHYATVNIGSGSQGTTRFANSEISQNVTTSDTNVSLTVYEGKKEATCATNVLTEEGLKQLAKDAQELLKYVPEGEYEAFTMSKEPVDERPPTGELATAFDAAARAAYIKEGVSYVKEGFTASGALVLTQQAIAVGDSLGAFRYAQYDQVTFNTVVTHQDGTDGAGECTSYTVVPDVIGEFKKAQATASAAMGAVSPELGAHTVVLSPLAFADLVGFMGFMLGADAIEDGSSFAIEKLGQKMFGDNFTVTDNVNCPCTRPVFFDYEGTPRQSVAMVDKGVVSSFLYDNKLAAKHKAPNTGHAVTNKGRGGYAINLQVEGGSQTLEEIIASTKKGIFINEFHYTNFVNPRTLQLTGLTRNGTFLIEDGKITTPISTVRFTESLLDAFNSITAISSDRTLTAGYMGASLVPGARIDNFHFTSKP